VVEPVPLKSTVWGLPLALSATESVPAAAPVAVGVKLTVIVQVLPAARLEPQLLFWVKTLLLVVNPVRESAPVPELVTVTDCGALAMPTPLEKVRVVGERVTAAFPVLVALLLW